MFKRKRDTETPAPQTPDQGSTPPKNAKHRPAISAVSAAISAVIIMAALVTIFMLWPDKPAWLNTSALTRWLQPANSLFKMPATLTIAEISPEAIDTIQFIDDKPTITPAPTLAMASPTPPKTITPAPTSQPPGAKATPSTALGQFKAQEGSPFYISAKPFQGNEQGCNWIGIAGQAFDAQNAPQSNLMVVVEGKLADKEVNLNTTTGTALLYGPAGYEINLSLKPQKSDGTLTIQLFDEMGKPLSPKVPFATNAACDKNLAIVNFVETE